MTDTQNAIASTTVLVERDVTIELRDGTKTACDIYRPSTAVPGPVVLHRTPYGKHRPAIAYLVLDPLRAADAGFTTVVQNVRGCYGSEGTFDPYFQEIDDGYDSVEWCATQTWCDGNVGMIGASYDAMLQLLAAIARPPHLRCIVPVLAASDIYDGWCYHGGVLQWGFMVAWVLPWLASEKAHARGLVDQLRIAVDALAETWQLLDPSDLPLTDELAPYFQRWIEHPSRDEFWKPVAVQDRYADIEVPSLHVGGWYDIFATGTARNFEALSARRPRGETRLIMGPWAHTVPTTTAVGSVDFGTGSGQFPTPLGYDLEEEYLSFLRRWLQGVGDLGEPPVKLFVMGPNAWRDESEWPLRRATTSSMFLHSGGQASSSTGDGELSWARPTESEPPDRFIYNPDDPVPTAGGNVCCMPGQLPHGPVDQASIEARADVLVYRSAPLDEELEITGSIRLQLWASTNAADTDMTAKLVDVRPCGVVLNIVDGILRGRYRSGCDAIRPLAPDEPSLWKIELGVTSYVFATGHRIGLEVSSSNFPRFARNLNTLADDRPVLAHQTIYHDSSRPSHLVLPVVPGAQAGA
jgi:putative CocE/NonD family hydrolase